MKSTPLFALALTLGAAATAAAQLTAAAQRDVSYTNSLLSGGLSAADEKICADNGALPQTAEHNTCQITRHFIADLSADPPQDRGFPTGLGGKYASPAEKDLMMKAMRKWRPS